jgi:hypothetical protein
MMNPVAFSRDGPFGDEGGAKVVDAAFGIGRHVWIFGLFVFVMQGWVGG